MKWHWYLKLTPEQVERLKEGLKSYFRFKLRLAAETVTYDEKKSEFSVVCNDPDVQSDISVYINGFMHALNFTNQ